MQANLAEVPSTSAVDGAARAPISAAQAAAAVSGGTTPAGATGNNTFVINLISSTTPVVLTRPDHAGLKRFTFFVSRRREDGRERFRLHMGYFDTQEEAEKLLDIVRTIYPGAWAGLAPGRRLATGGTPGTGSAVAGTTATASTDTAPQGPAPKGNAPTAASPGEVVVKPHSVAASISAPATASAPAAAINARPPRESPKRIEVQALALVPDEGRRQLSDVTLDLEEPSSQLEQQAARRSFGNVRDAIASLGDSAIRAPALSEIPELKPAIIPVARPVVRAAQSRQAEPQQAQARQAQVQHAQPVRPQPARPQRAAEQAHLTDTATLRLLETGEAAKAAKATKTAKMPALTPTQSGPTPREEKPWYAVQLMWAVQPIALTQVPQLAIFSAYTLYGAEGNRDGRRWYGLRLGFFTDAVSAKQVAHYVRGDFATVSVVPVTAREREHALQAVIASPAKTTAGATGAASGQTAEPGAAGSTAAGSATRGKNPEFAFIEGTESQITRLRPGPGDAGKAARSTQSSSSARPSGTALVGGKRPSRGAPGKRAKPRPAGQVHARAPAKPRTLEETLEILGAGELQVADGAAGLLRDSGFGNDLSVGHPKSDAAKAKSSSKLAKLIDRLAERMGN